MAFITGSILLDAPASALNNLGAEDSARTDNIVGVKKIRTAGETYVYVSAQAFRYWLRVGLETAEESPWRSSPIIRENKIAYTDANPQVYWDDDLFGYMRAKSQKADSKPKKGKPLETEAKFMDVEEKRDLTRISPFRVSTFVSVSPVRIVDDFGTMTRQQGDPVPYEHQFYRAHLLGLLSLDLTCAGTFFDGERVGIKNLDENRRNAAKEANLDKVVVRKQSAFRLPLEERTSRVKALVGALATLAGGAKQTQHYTDLTPAVIFLAATKHGNNPFYRMLGNVSGQTEFHKEAFLQLMEVYADSFLSPVYVGWAKGFLDDERKKLESTISEAGLSSRVHVAHPVEQVRRFTDELGKPENAVWFD
jgi:CRISPR-associated protein Cst2